MKYYSKVLVEDGQTYMLLPEKLLNDLKLIENEVLEWSIDGETVTIKRTKHIDNRSAE